VNNDIKRKSKKSKSTEKNKSNNLHIKDIEIVQDQMKKEEEDILLHLRATVILIDYIFEYFCKKVKEKNNIKIFIIFSL
jgi:hypothetical protein